MSKKSKANRERKKTQRKSSTLQQHKRKGNTFSPPMMQLPNMTPIPWLRDNMPNMLWLCALIHIYGQHEGLTIACKVIDRIDTTLGHDYIEDVDAKRDVIVTGELTEFEKVSFDKRKAVIDDLKKYGLYEQGFPSKYRRFMSKYSSAPGNWLIENDTDDSDSESEVTKLLEEIVSAANHGRDNTATKAKAIVLRGWLKSGKYKIASNTTIADDFSNLLPKYPDQLTDDERKRIESQIRASYMGLANFPKDPVDTENRKGWAETFWNTNWRLYKCVDTIDESDRGIDDSKEEIVEQRKLWQQELVKLQKFFLDAHNQSDPGLYAPDRHEVLTAITYRQLRAINVMLNDPMLWTMEHGSGTIRALVEAKITMRWLIDQKDERLYVQYKEYGRGHLKLLKLHLEAYRESLDESYSELDQQIEYLDSYVNLDIWEEFQNISVSSTFSNISMRRMADEVNMGNDYRLMFQPASGNIHGEWTALDQSALTVCKNPLHRWHRIPNNDDALMIGPGIVQTALSQLNELIQIYTKNINRETR